MNVNPVFFAVGYRHNGQKVIDNDHLVQNKYFALKRRYAYQKREPKFNWEVFTLRITGDPS